MIRNYSFGHPTAFVGRAQELADIAAQLLHADCRLLTLTGLGGSGKTRLALQAATSLAARFPDGAVFVALQPLTRSDLLVPSIAQALGLSFYGAAQPQQQLLDHLHDKSLLLLLDNFEHLLDGAALLSDILAAAPGVTLLVTSREALALREEWLYPLKGLTTPPSVYATSLEAYDAVQLFLSHARRVQPSFDPAHEHAAVVRICMLTAGLPLAIELAAGWLKGLSATHIAGEIQRTLDFLSATTRNVEPRHRSMRAVFDQSWRLLSEDERLIFARLSVFAGDFAAEAAEMVAGASFSSLAALVEKSLVQIEAHGRFGIHELLRQYGMEQLEASGETEATHARHSQYFAQLMLQHEKALKQPQQLEGLQALERDFENIRLAWDWSAKNQQLAHIHTMLNGLYLFGFLRSRYREIIAIFQRALEPAVADAPLLGRLLARRWGYLHWLYQADYQEALSSIEQALAIAVAENNRFEIAFGHLMAAFAMISMHRYADALPHLETSQALFEAIDEPYYACWVLHRLGYIYYYWALAALSCGLGKPADVRAYIQKLLQVSHPEANSVTTVWIVPSVAYMLAQSDPEKAVELLAWVFVYPDLALNWARQWPLLGRLQAQLQAAMDRDSYRMRWENGKALTLDSIAIYLQQAFRATADPTAAAPQQPLLTAREKEILRLIAVGMTNPQIAAQLVIGAGTVKTHTLNIYRKLEVANRTQAIVRAQELGLLPA